MYYIYKFNYDSVLHICIEGKLVRKSFMGVFPDIIELNTYLIPSEYYRFSFTVGKNCTPVTMESQYDGTLNEVAEPYVIILK